MAGRPLICWTIEQALASLNLSATIVSTDDLEIAAVARDIGADVPFMRPAALASDTATSVEVALHTLDWWKENRGAEPEYLMMLQPTSPLRTVGDIDAVVALRQTIGGDAVVSVGPLEHPPHWIRRVGNNGELLPWLDQAMPPARQATERLYQLNGALYLIRTKTLREERTFFPSSVFAYCMPAERSVDIDTSLDFLLAEQLLLQRNEAG